jgi:diguanylate cyclase (GGDEF)-like protein/PAS domain S-box-containing protein
MSDDKSGKIPPFVKQRMEHLESVNRETVQALELITQLGDLKTSLNQIDDPVIILGKADSRIRQLLDLDATAFYVFAENGLDLELAYSLGESREKLDSDFQHLTDNLHVAKCINGTRPVFATLPGEPFPHILHPLYTSSRVRGMFLGKLKQKKRYISDSFLTVFSIILGNTANMLEGFALYGMIRSMNAELEQRVDELAEKQRRLKTEVARRKVTEDDLRNSRQMLRMVMENIPQYIFWKDTQSNYLGCNRNFAQAAGFDSPEQIIGKQDEDLPWTSGEADFFRKVDREVMEKNESNLNLIERITMADGVERFVDTNKIPLRNQDNQVIGILGTFQDITAQKAYEEQLTHQAFHDALTGLPNRALITERIDRAIRRAQRNNRDLFSVLLLDLDRFKYTNDSLGHLAGDRLLIEMGQRLSEVIREVDTVARLGGDEFAILIEDIESPREVVKVLRRLITAIREPFSIHGNKLHSSASIGVVLDTRGYTTPEDVLRDADVAMYDAKRRGGGRFKAYTLSMRDSIMKTATLHNDLITGIGKNEFALLYQPIYSVGKGDLKGVEALVRWNHPVKGQLAPDEFIPLAEDSGLIVELGRHLLIMACEQAVKWQESLPEPIYVSVNISAKQLRNPAFVSFVRDVLHRTGLDPAYLALEMTETVLMDRPETTLGILNQLKQLGLRIFLDDFGTGYSSLSYLQQFPVDVIKIDRFFVSSLNSGESGREIVTAIMALAESLNMNVIAEGVEETGQLESLNSLRCDLAQGYHFARPLTAEAVDSLLKQTLGSRQSGH